MGVTSAIFQIIGNTVEMTKLLINNAIAGHTDGRQSGIGILSLPGALLEGIFIIMSSISLHSTACNVNCSDKGCCLGTKLSSLMT
jgi:hypothetical protein